MHENKEELTDSQQIIQAINSQVEEDDSDQHETVMSEKIDEMSILHIDNIIDKNNSSAMQRKIDYMKQFKT